MTKAKTKDVGFDGRATETAPGVWSFVIGKLHWEYHEGIRGLNLFLVDAKRGPQGACYVKNLREAGLFAEGFLAGVTVMS